MRVIITGGTGLIGRALAADLTARGREVIVLSRSPERATNLPADVRAERWDGRTAAGWGALADGAEAIVNLAGENLAAGRWSSERRRAIRESRLHAGEAVLEAIGAATQKPRVLVQASAAGFYGPHGNEPVTEATAAGSDFLAQLCVAWEASTAAVEAQGVRRAIARTGIVLSTAGGALPRLLLPYRFFAGGRLGNGRQWYPWIHLLDEVAAIRFLIDTAAASGTFNLTAPQPLTNGALAHVIGNVLGRPALLPAPAIALRLLMGDMATVVLDGQRALPSRLLELGYQFQFPSAEAALRDLLH
ncbi:MAG TPA: TIGR01777 family oxidoreductase [Chloroflexota bacterium]